MCPCVHTCALGPPGRCTQAQVCAKLAARAGAFVIPCHSGEASRVTRPRQVATRTLAAAASHLPANSGRVHSQSQLTGETWPKASSGLLEILRCRCCRGRLVCWRRRNKRRLSFEYFCTGPKKWPCAPEAAQHSLSPASPLQRRRWATCSEPRGRPFRRRRVMPANLTDFGPAALGTIRRGAASRFH